MVTADFARLIREHICAEVSISKVASDRFSVGMPLTFGDGDSCRIMVTAEPSGEFLLSDGGFVSASALVDGVDLLSSGHEERFRRVAAFYGVKELSGELRMQANSDDIGDAVFAFTQACLEVAKLSELTREVARKSRAFTARFRKIVEVALRASPFNRNWHDESRDPRGIYIADYRLPKDDFDWLIFGAGSPGKCWKSASTVQHYKFTKLKLKTVFAYSASAERNQDAFAVLADNADHRFSMETERGKLRSFLKRL
jgi:hypothetical protein